MRSLIQVYALVVCFCCMMCFVVALGVGAYDIVEIAAPEFTLTSYPYSYTGSTLTDGKELTKKAIKAVQAEQFRLGVEYQRKSAKQSLIFVGIVCLIDAVVFGVHWRIARREESTLVSKSIDVESSS